MYYSVRSLINSSLSLSVCLLSLIFSPSLIADTVSDSQGRMIIEYESNSQLFNFFRQGKFTKDKVFFAGKAQLSAVDAALVKYGNWVETSKKENINNVKKRITFIAWNRVSAVESVTEFQKSKEIDALIRFGKEAKDKLKKREDTNIIDFTFVADDKGYKLDIDMHSGTCDGFPDKKSFTCTRLRGVGALKAEDVKNLRALIAKADALTQQKSKADLLQ